MYTKYLHEAIVVKKKNIVLKIFYIFAVDILLLIIMIFQYNTLDCHDNLE